MSTSPLSRLRARLGRRIAGLALLGFATATSPAIADDVASCEKPFVFPDLAVNVLVVPYELAGREVRESDPQLSEATRGLSWLLTMDSAFAASYGKLGYGATNWMEGARQSGWRSAVAAKR
jgi:hypothetical protein